LLIASSLTSSRDWTYSPAGLPVARENTEPPPTGAICLLDQSMARLSSLDAWRGAR